MQAHEMIQKTRFEGIQKYFAEHFPEHDLDLAWAWDQAKTKSIDDLLELADLQRKRRKGE